MWCVTVGIFYTSPRVTAGTCHSFFGLSWSLYSFITTSFLSFAAMTASPTPAPSKGLLELVS